MSEAAPSIMAQSWLQGSQIEVKKSDCFPTERKNNKKDRIFGSLCEKGSWNWGSNPLNKLNVQQKKKNKYNFTFWCKNAFNLLNRQSFLHNISYLCPSISAFVKNCYNASSRLFILGGTKILSKDGTTQGNLVSIAIHK